MGACLDNSLGTEQPGHFLDGSRQVCPGTHDRHRWLSEMLAGPTSGWGYQNVGGGGVGRESAIQVTLDPPSLLVTE